VQTVRRAVGHWQSVGRAGWLKLLWIAGGERRGAARYSTERDGTGRERRAGPGPPSNTRAHTDVHGAHTLKAGALACSRHRQRHRTQRRGKYRRAFTRIESESGCRTNGRSVGRDVGGGRARQAGRQRQASRGRQAASGPVYTSLGALLRQRFCLPACPRLGTARSRSGARTSPTLPRYPSLRSSVGLSMPLRCPRRSSVTRLSTRTPLAQSLCSGIVVPLRSPRCAAPSRAESNRAASRYLSRRSSRCSNRCSLP